MHEAGDRTQDGYRGQDERRDGKDQRGEDTGRPGGVGRSGGLPAEETALELRLEGKPRDKGAGTPRRRGPCNSRRCGRDQAPSEGVTGPPGLVLSTQPSWMNPGPWRGGPQIWHLLRTWDGPWKTPGRQSGGPRNPREKGKGLSSIFFSDPLGGAARLCL